MWRYIFWHEAGIYKFSFFFWLLDVPSVISVCLTGVMGGYDQLLLPFD